MTAQTVLVLPVILGVLWMAVHVGFLLHAGNVAAAVADATARAAAGSDSPSGSALRRVADATASELGGRIIGPPEAVWSGQTVVVSVTVAGPDLVPFLPSTVTRRSAAPVEQFLMENER